MKRGEHLRTTDAEKAEFVKQAERVRDISVDVYKIRLEHSSGGGSGAVERMLKDDDDGGVKLRGRAESYDVLTRAYLEVLDLDLTIRNMGRLT